VTAIRLDEQPIECPDRAGTVGDVVSVVRSRFDPRQRMIVALQCDGQEVGSDDIPRTLQRPLTDFNSIHLISDVPRSVALAALRDAQSQLLETRMLREQIADAFSQSRMTDAMDALSTLVRLCAQMHQAVLQSAALTGLDPRDLHVPGAARERDAAGNASMDTSDSLEAVTRGLRQVREALMQQDFVVLADQMRYEMQGTLDAWGELLSRVIACVEALPPR